MWEPIDPNDYYIFALEDIPIGGVNNPPMLAISYCDIQGGEAAVYVGEECVLSWGSNNIDADPLFVDADNGDYHLLPDSPCINAGDNSAIEGFEADMEANPRIADAIVDMGAYERSSQHAVGLLDMQITLCGAVPMGASTTGTFVVVGSLADCPSSLSTDTIDITFGPYAESLNDITEIGSLCLYRGSTGGISLFLLNKTTGVFVLMGHDVELAGLASPVEISLQLGDYLGIGRYLGSVPLSFMRGYDDVLVIDSAVRAGTLAIIRGGVAVEDTTVVLSQKDINFRWADDEDSVAIIPAGSLLQFGNWYWYYDRTNKIMTAIFDLTRCTFYLIINDSDFFLSGELRIQFGDFDEAAQF